MDKYEVGNAACLMDKLSWTNEELIKIVEANEIVLGYFNGRGEYFGLIRDKIRGELEQLNYFMCQRGLK